MDEVRGDDASTELAYALRGVGGDASCPLQIVADEAVTTPEGIVCIVTKTPTRKYEN